MIPPKRGELQVPVIPFQDGRAERWFKRSTAYSIGLPARSANRFPIGWHDLLSNADRVGSATKGCRFWRRSAPTAGSVLPPRFHSRPVPLWPRSFFSALSSWPVCERLETAHGRTCLPSVNSKSCTSSRSAGAYLCLASLNSVACQGPDDT